MLDSYPQEGYSHVVYGQSLTKPLAVIGSDLDLLDDMVASDFNLIGYFSTRDKGIPFPYLGTHEQISKLKSEVRLVVASDDVAFRELIYTKFPNRISGYKSPSAKISNSAQIDESAVIYPLAYISHSCHVGKCSKLSVGVQVHHESRIGAFTVIAPMSLILGRVSVGNQSFIGANVSIRPGVKIQDQVTIGMGSNVVCDLSQRVVAWGNPARVVELQKSIISEI